MEIEYDLAKNEKNIRERGLSFDQAKDFDFETAIQGPIFRKGEWRVEAVGYLTGRLHVLCFKRTGSILRVISFRKANEREGRKHGRDLYR